MSCEYVKRERICEVLNDRGRWDRVPMSAVMRGDIFRLWDDEGLPMVCAGGERVEELSVATEDATADPCGCVGVGCRPLNRGMLHLEES